MQNSICGIDCTKCGFNTTCGGCAKTGGKPFGGECIIAKCSLSKGENHHCDCGGLCKLKSQLIAEFNALDIQDMPEITNLNALQGSFVNLEYTLPGGQKIKFWDDSKIYLGNQVCKDNSTRCYGLTADENYLLVCEYGDNGSKPEIVVYKSRKES